MKNRFSKILNFFAFNLLFFALYLNFIHKEKTTAAIPEAGRQNTAVFSGTVPVQNPENYPGIKTEATPAGVHHPTVNKTEKKNP